MRSDEKVGEWKELGWIYRESGVLLLMILYCIEGHDDIVL